MKKIIDIRKGLDISAKEMAAHLNISVEHYCGLESGQQEPAAATITKLKLLDKCVQRKPVADISITQREEYETRRVKLIYNKWMLVLKLNKAVVQYDMCNHEHTSLLLLTMTDYLHITKDAFQDRITELEYTLYRTSAVIQTLKLKAELLASQIDTLSGYLGKADQTYEGPTFHHN